MKKPRLFLAASARLYDYTAIRHDFQMLVNGRWTPPKHLHATIVFFGQNYTAEELLHRIADVDISAESSQIDAIGFFKHNRILHATTANASLQRLCRDVTAALGLPPPRLTPHITLMRVKEILDSRAFYDRLETYKKRPIGELSDRIGLFSSELTPQGAEYTLIREWHGHL